VKNSRSLAVTSIACGAALCAASQPALAACDSSVAGVLTCTGTFDSTLNPVIGTAAGAGLHTLNISDLTADIAKAADGYIVRASSLNTNFTANIDLSGRTLENTASAGASVSHLMYFANASANSISVTAANGSLVATGGSPSVTGIVAWSMPGAGSGGDVSVWQQEDLSMISRPSVGGATNLTGAHGIFAITRLAGAIDIRSDGDISADSFGIWARLQGADGAEYTPGGPALGSGGGITINSTGHIESRLGGINAASEVNADILVRQSGTVVSEQRSGIQVMSVGGDIDVEIAGSVTSASQATSTATGDANWIAGLRLGATRDDAGGTPQLFGGGGNNTITITSSGSIQSAGGIGEYAIIAMDGNDAVLNSGHITGSVDLDMVCPRLDPACTPLPGKPANVNAFSNLQDGVFEMGPVVNVGAGMAFNNAGTLQPGGTGEIGTVALTGDFEQTATGRLVIDVDAVSGNADRIDISGSAVLAGTIDFNLLSATGAIGQATIITATDGVINAGITAPVDTLTTSYTLDFTSANEFVLAYEIDLAATTALEGLNANQAAVARHLNEVLVAGGSGPLFGGLSGLTSVADYAAALNQISPEHYTNLQASSLLATQNFSRTLVDCRTSDGGRALSHAGDCLWADISRSFNDRDATFENAGFDETSTRISAGTQLTVGDGVRLTMAGRYEDLTQNGISALSEGDRGHAGIGLSTAFGGLQMTGAVLGSYGRFDTTRQFGFGSFSGTATSNPDFGTVAGLLSASYPLSMGQWHISPRFDVTVTHLEAQRVVEGGGNGAALRLGRAEDTYVSLAPMIEVGGQWAAWSDAVVRPFFRVGVVWNTNDDFAVQAQLNDAVGVDGFDTVTGIDAVMADVSAGVDLAGANGTTVRLSYDGTFGETVASQSFGTKIGLSF
jgi:uncharacterized protein with beta-barrel porin domain